MSGKTFDPNEPVRYMISFNRFLRNGEQYVAMRTSIEAVEAVDKERVIDKVSRALKRELPHDENLDSLVASSGELVWEVIGYLEPEEILSISRNGVIVTNKIDFGIQERIEHFHIGVFTKANEEEAEKLFASL